MKKLHVYGCGGAGINIVNALGLPKDWKDGCDLETTYVDTSLSNISGTNIKNEDVYVLEGKDGSGKKRDHNHEDISIIIRDLVLKHKPGDFNVVVFSLSGGSGSVIGPLLISEIIKRDIPVVGFVIGTEESVTTCKNTLNTIMSLDNLSRNAEKPIVVAYQHNERGGIQSHVDGRICSAIRAISVLAAGDSQGLDSQDLIHWLYYNKMKTVTAPPQLALLDIYGNNDDVVKYHPTPISIASIYKNKDQPGLTAVPEYHCTGYKDISKDLYKELHYVIDVNKLPETVERIKSVIKQQMEVSSSRPRIQPLTGKNSNVADTGMVFDE